MRFLPLLLPMLTAVNIPVHQHMPSCHANPMPVKTQVRHTDTLKQKTGEFSFTYNNQQYDAFVVTPGKQIIRMYWQTQKNEIYRTIDAVKQSLVQQNEQVLMITNGGMFAPDYIPVGLFIAAGKEYRSLDTARNQPGNFYLQPNGVFYSDYKGYHIISTTAYLHRSATEKKQVTYATQSGPMLISNGTINPQFNPQSKNTNLRSGVGILSNGNVVFIISKEANTTFFDFASIFKDLFGCSDALYLDGAISKMYLPQHRPEDTGGDFGAIISVTGKR